MFLTAGKVIVVLFGFGLQIDHLLSAVLVYCYTSYLLSVIWKNEKRFLAPYSFTSISYASKIDV